MEGARCDGGSPIHTAIVPSFQVPRSEPSIVIKYDLMSECAVIGVIICPLVILQLAGAAIESPIFHSGDGGDNIPLNRSNGARP